ncbi:MAG: enoyl-CoA delta isomerase 1 [Actinomycetota bacterium]|nr:enoyl-CoA delta isomerase 1 [Actinomycetota bacterium]
MATALVALLKIFPTPGTPVVAAIRGETLAGGYSVVCATDAALAPTGSRIGAHEASIGVRRRSRVIRLPPVVDVAWRSLT